MLLVYVLHMAVLAGLGWLLYRQDWVKQIKAYYVPALLLKLFCGVCLGLLYFYYYGAGDTITYQQESLKLTAYAIENFTAYLRLLVFNEFESESFRASILFTRNPGFSNSFFMLKIISALNLLTGSSYYLNSCYFSLFSFWGSAKLAAVLSTIFPNHRKAAVLALLFFPSVVFWGSGLLKDAVLMGSMMWVVAFALQVAHEKKLQLSSVILFLPMLYTYVRIKVFLSAPLLAVLFVYTIVTLLAGRYQLLRKLKVQVLVIVGFIAIAGVTAMQLIGIFNPDFIFRQIIVTYNVLLANSQQVPHIEYPYLEPTWQSMAFYAPQAFFNAVYRPFAGEALQPLYLAVGLENLLLLVLSGTALGAFVKHRAKHLTLFHVCLIFYIVVTAVMIGLTTPNFGSLSRYRIAFLPFLAYLLLRNVYVQAFLKKLKLP
ncbi:hypothetical protein C1N53_00240 [Pontibacter sp. SGAir0037]|nr:hypothetical protein C1N53_00240 [Pontibacter sp. SGAir0037]